MVAKVWNDPIFHHFCQQFSNASICVIVLKIRYFPFFFLNRIFHLIFHERSLNCEQLYIKAKQKVVSAYTV